MINTIYLSGPMVPNCSLKEQDDWRYRIIGGFVGKCITPVGRNPKNTFDLVEGDKRDIRRSDVILVNWFKQTAGTSMEIMYAYTIGVPVLVINTSGTPKLHPWVEHHASKVFYDIFVPYEQVIMYLNNGREQPFIKSTYGTYLSPTKAVEMPDPGRNTNHWVFLDEYKRQQDRNKLNLK